MESSCCPEEFGGTWHEGLHLLKKVIEKDILKITNDFIWT